MRDLDWEYANEIGEDWAFEEYFAKFPNGKKTDEEIEDDVIEAMFKGQIY